MKQLKSVGATVGKTVMRAINNYDEIFLVFGDDEFVKFKVVDGYDGDTSVAVATIAPDDWELKQMGLITQAEYDERTKRRAADKVRRDALSQRQRYEDLKKQFGDA